MAVADLDAAEAERVPVRGGPFYRFEQRLHLASRDPRTVAKRIAAAFAVLWLPFTVIVLGQRWATGAWDPLFTRSEVHVRLLLALSLFLFGELSLEDRILVANQHLKLSRVLPPASTDAWERLLGRLRHICDGRASELTILAIIYAATLASYLGQLPSWLLRWLAPSIHEAQKGWHGNSAAWWWYVLVAQPFFLFVVGRWLFRWGIWWAELWALPRRGPAVRPAHADGAGGLAFLAGPLFSFRFLVTGLAASLASVWFDEIGRGEAVPSMFAKDFLRFVVLILVLGFAPYAALTPLLIRTKRWAEVRYSILVARYVEAFEGRWLEPGSQQKPIDADTMLGNSDFQSLADIGNSFRVVGEMRPHVPPLRELQYQVVAASVPIGVIVLVYVIPATEIVQSVVRKFIGG